MRNIIKAAAIFGVLLASAACEPAFAARNIVIDLGDGNFPNSGAHFDLSDNVIPDLRGDGTTGAITIAGGHSTGDTTLPFTINYGEGQVSTVFMNENGAITFGSALPAGFTSVSKLSDLGVPIIAPFYADLQDSAPPSDGFPAAGDAYYAVGGDNPFKDPVSMTYLETGELPAMRFTWWDVGVDGTPTTASAQAIITSAGANGDFNLEFLWGDSTTQPTDGSLAGFVLGSNVVNITGPYGPDTASFFEFRDGKLVGATTAVPEPATWAMMLAGFATLGGALRLRPRRIATA